MVFLLLNTERGLDMKTKVAMIRASVMLLAISASGAIAAGDRSLKRHTSHNDSHASAAQRTVLQGQRSAVGMLDQLPDQCQADPLSRDQLIEPRAPF